MKKIFVLLGVLLLIAGAKTGIAQCATYALASQFSCSNSAGCNNTIEIDTLEVSQYNGAYFQYESVSCCGIGGYPNFIPTGQCYSSELKDPSLRKRLMELAQNEDFLIATCKGEFVPLTLAVVDPPPIIRESKPKLVF